MTVGFHSPMPPVRSGVADYAAALLPVLRTRMDVTEGEGTVNLYQLGNNQLHADIYRRALDRPGVVVLHDAVMHHFALGFFERQAYVEEFVYNYGEWSRQLAESLWQDRARSAADPRYFAYPMLRRVVERSRAVIVHNPAAARMVLAHVPGARVFEVPHLWIPVPTSPAHTGPFRCGVFGHLRESKRLPVAIEACRRAGVELVVAGSLPSDLERALGPSLHGVRREPYSTLQRYWELAHQVDCCLNLRYPQAGETSGVGILLMGIGRPVVFTDGEEVSRYPADACIRIQHGLGELDNLVDVLVWLKERRSHAREIGRRAAEWIRREHSAERVADGYWRALQLD